MPLKFLIQRFVDHIVFAAGSCASICTGLGNPLDCLRIRWQVRTPQHGEEFLAFGRAIVRDEGLVSGLWRPGLGANMLAIGVSASIGYGLYPIFRDQVTSVILYRCMDQ
jgi:hypothetical protein